MNSKSDCSNGESSPSRGRKRGSEYLNCNRNVESFSQKDVGQPPKHHSYLPEMTRQVLLDTSDSESGSLGNKSGDEYDRESPFPKNPRISPLEVELPHEAPTRSSNIESTKSNTTSDSTSSCFKAPGKGPRFVPTPHPDMIQCCSSCLEPAGGLIMSSRIATSHFNDSIHNIKNPSSGEPRESSEPSISDFISPSLPPSRFSFKTSSGARKTRKPQVCRSLVGTSESEPYLGNQVISHLIGPLSIPSTIHRTTSRRYSDRSDETRRSHSFSHLEYSTLGNGSSHQNRSSQPPLPFLITNIKCEPVECDSRIDKSQDVPTILQNRSSEMPESGRGPMLNVLDGNRVSYAHSSSSQLGLGPHISARQTSDLQPEEIGYDHMFTATQKQGARGLTNSSNIPSTSPSQANRPALSSVSFTHSNLSYLQSVVGNSNRDSSGLHGHVPSSSRNSNSQERQIISESSDSGYVAMSFVHKKNKIAGSSYNSTTGQVQLLETVTENFEFCATLLALRNITPSILVLPSAGASRFVKELRAKIVEDQMLKDCQFQSLSPHYFAYSFARRTILESPLWEGCLTFRTEDAKKNAIVSNINLNDERLVCAFGGLLYYLSTGCPQLGPSSSPSPITCVQHMKLSNKLWLDSESFKNLQIFDPAEHPSSFKWSSANRDDGKGMFGLFGRFCSAVGMTKLKSFLSNPVNCRRTLEKRHEVINFFLSNSNFNAVEALRTFVSQMSSSSVIMGYLSSPTLRGGHWKHIYRHIYYTVSYAEVCRSHGDQSELFRELGSKIVDGVYSMAHNLERVIDLVNMENNETFVIKYGFHPPLDAAKEKFSRLKVAMDKVTPYEFDSVPPFITRIQMMYIPEMKFLLSIPFWAPDLTKEELNLPNLEFKFSANKTAFYKTRRCYELDELLGDAQTDIINEESMIIQSLRNYLKKQVHHIVGMVQKIAEIECIFALAKVAREERYTKPEILDDCVIDVRGGWHPLLDVPSNEVIKNDMVSSIDTSLVKLIYGPNASGKSIYLKQVGLIMYLVHVGSYVPAVSARVGLLGRILARTTLEESITSMSSTMLTELKKIQDAVKGCAKDTLVILDEVGKGSTETNCIAIVASAVNYFLSQDSDCPHVLISTHLSGINDFVRPPDGRNIFELSSMEYIVTEGEIVFLYKICRCAPNASFVFEILENSEFAARIVKIARTVLEALRTGENFLPYCETRIQRSHKYLNFIRKFVNIDMAKPGYLEKLQSKIQRYYEKPYY